MFDIYWYDYDDCNDVKELIAKAIASSRTEYIWLCHLAVDYSRFNLRYLPKRHQAKMMHAWASHDNPDCYTTWLIPVENSGDTVFHNDILPILYPAIGKWQWKKDPLIDYSSFNFNWFPSVWDWQLNHEFTMLGKERLSYTTLDRGSNNIKYHAANLTYSGTHYDICCVDTNTHALPTHDYKVRLVTTMEEALKSAIKRATKPWLWIVSDTCNYDGFDFEWLPEEGEEHQIHCWPSGTCEKGDTFLVHVLSFNPDELKFNFEHEPIQRKRWPVALSVTGNGLAWDLNNCPRNGGIYTVYSYNSFLDYPDVCLWDKRPVVSLNRSNSTCLVPRDCIVNNEIYEYPHLLRYPQYGYDIHTDVIFISNGEPMADENYKHLLEIFPNAKRSDGVVGRELAYKTAASLSDTPWFYAVFAKTWVLDTFDFSYSPDYWQEPKHYIFHSRNPLNKLEYGAMNINLYNKKLVLETKPGLDFTLSQKHTVIPICASESRFNSDAWITWRSAFREVLKLRQETEQHGRIEIAHRLHVWKTVAEGENAEWCLRGANDADQYYTKVGGDPEKLQLSFDWKWLKEYYDTIY
jgi:hypothetical protein